MARLADSRQTRQDLGVLLARIGLAGDRPPPLETQLRGDAAIQLSLAELTGLLDQVRDMGQTQLRLSGGEPTLHPEFPAIARGVAGLRGGDIEQFGAMLTASHRLPG